MSDLTDNDLQELRRSTFGQARDAMVELQRRRAEQAGGREHVERVVREELRRDFGDDYEVMLDCLARRVADRMSVPVLSGEERATAAWALRHVLRLYSDYRGKDSVFSSERFAHVEAVADRLSVPVLSSEDVQLLESARRYIRSSCDLDTIPNPDDARRERPHPVAWVDVLDRLIAAGKP